MPLKLLTLCSILAMPLVGCSITTTTVVTATPSPASPTSAPTSMAGSPTPAITASTAGPTVAPTSSAAPESFVTQDADTVTARGYNPGQGHAETSDGFGHSLYAFRAVCKGSGDGYCQKMFFFIDGRYLGTDTSSPSTFIKDFTASGTGSVDVTYAHYAPKDPLCCPSLTPITITYHWNGSHLIPSGTPPGH